MPSSRGAAGDTGGGGGSDVNDIASRVAVAAAECKRAQQLLGEAAGSSEGAIAIASADGDGEEDDDVQDVHEAWACLERARAVLDGHCGGKTHAQHGAGPGSAPARRLQFVKQELVMMGEWLRSDPYTALACTEDDSTKDIKKSYRRLVRRCVCSCVCSQTRCVSVVEGEGHMTS